MDKQKIRCAWANINEEEQKYHDTDWGRPKHDDAVLFEMLILEGQQAGLSWDTILKRREKFRVAYDQFNPEIIALYTDEKIEALMQDSSIIRNRRKIEAAIANAKAYLKLKEECGSLDHFLWRYVDNQPIKNHWTSMEEVPAKTPLSEEISKELKKRGFKFVGPTIIYAYMQSIGMVNDHLVDCWCYSEDLINS